MEETKCLSYLVKFIVTILLGKSVTSVSTLMENFIDGVCISTESDIPKWGKSYFECLDECRSRTECTAVNVHALLRYCNLNMDSSGTETDCPGYLLSKRSGWTQPDIPECNGVTCSASQACGIDSSTRTPDCYFKECPPIEELENGNVMGNQRFIGARIVYACNNGYTLDGNDSRNCTVMGDWSGTLPTCEQEYSQTTAEAGGAGAGGNSGIEENTEVVENQVADSAEV